MAKQSSGTGKGGKSFQDRELAAKVRTKGLEELYLILIDSPQVKKWSELKKATLQRLAPALVPRINEHSGVDGGPIEIKGVTISVRRK